MGWRRTGKKLLPELMMTPFTCPYMRHQTSIIMSKPWKRQSSTYTYAGPKSDHYWNGKVVRVTTMVFTGDVEVWLQRLQWVPGLSHRRLSGFIDNYTSRCPSIDDAKHNTLHSYKNTRVSFLNMILNVFSLITWHFKMADDIPRNLAAFRVLLRVVLNGHQQRSIVVSTKLGQCVHWSDTMPKYKGRLYCWDGQYPQSYMPSLTKHGSIIVIIYVTRWVDGTPTTEVTPVTIW